jgi:acyl carrier protein
LAHVTLISAIESEFGLAIDIGDSMDMTSFDAVLAYLEEHPA